MIQPSYYVGLIDDGKKLVNEANTAAIGKPDNNGFKVPFILKEKLFTYWELVSEEIGKLNWIIEHTKDNKKYIEMKKELIEVREDIKVLQAKLS